VSGASVVGRPAVARFAGVRGDDGEPPGRYGGGCGGTVNVTGGTGRLVSGETPLHLIGLDERMG